MRRKKTAANIIMVLIIAALAVGGTAGPRGTGQDEEDRGLPALQPVQEKVSLWAGYARPAGPQL